MIHKDYNRLAGQIITLFPNETTGTYYVPPIRKCNSSTGRSIVAKGRLVDKCKNVISRCGDAVPKRKRVNEESVEEKKSFEDAGELPNKITSDYVCKTDPF